MAGKKILAFISCFILSAVFLMTVTGTCLGGDVTTDTPVGQSLSELDDGLTGGISWSGTSSTEGTLSADGSSAGGSASWEGSGEASASSPGIPSSGAPQLPIPVPGNTPQPPSLPAPEVPGNAPNPADLLNPDSLPVLLDPSNLSALLPDTSALLPDAGSMPSPGTLPGLLDPSAFPGLEDLPGVDDIVSNLPAPPTGQETPSLPSSSPEFNPEDLLKMVEKSDRILVLVSLNDLLEARLALGKNLETAPLLGIHVALFKALAAEGSLGLKKVNDDAFLVPLEFYLKYWAGDQGWQEIFNLLLPLEISFPGAGMLPEGVQELLDKLHEFVLKPLLPLLPIYQPEETPSVEPPVPEEENEVPPVEVGGEVVTNPQGTGELGDHLPFTGAELTLLLGIIMALSAAGFLLGRLERKFKNKAGGF